MTCCRNDVDHISVRSSSPSRCTTPVKYVRTGCNNIRVKQAGGKDFTIQLSPAKMDLSLGQGGCKPGLSMSRSAGPLSIVIHPTPMNKVSVHPAFNSLADRKSAAVVQAAKERLSYKIYSPSDNVSIQLMGGSLADTLGEAPPYNSKMLLKGGGRGDSPSRCRMQQRCGSPWGQQSRCGSPRGQQTRCGSPRVQQSRCGSPRGQPSRCGSPRVCASGNQNALKLSLPGSGMKVNIKMGRDGTKVRCVSPGGSQCGSASGSGSCGGGDDGGCKMSRLPYRFHQPTISSLIATRMTQLKKEMLMNSGFQHAPPPAPPFVYF